MYMLQYTGPHFNAIKSVSHYQNTLYVYCIQLIYIHKSTHMALSSVQSHFTLNWTLCEDRTSDSDNIKF